MVLISETRCTTELKVGMFLLCQSSSCPYSGITKAAWFQVAYKGCYVHLHYPTFFLNRREYRSLTPSRGHAGKSTGSLDSPNDEQQRTL